MDALSSVRSTYNIQDIYIYIRTSIYIHLCIFLANTIAYAVDINYYYALRQRLVNLNVLQSRKYKNVNCTLHKEL